MALTCNLFNFCKKRNSTATPAASFSETDYNPSSCLLKDGTGVINPVFIFSFEHQLNPARYNYAQLPEFGRFYYINEWVYDHGVWLAHMSVDVLASWKTAIGDTAAYVVRSSAAYDDGIIDTMYPATGGTTTQVTTGALGLAENWDDGVFVLGIISKDSDKVGMTTYYAMTLSQFSSFAEYLFGSVSWAGIAEEDLASGVQKALLSPIQYIVSCKWYPIAWAAGTVVETIPIGYWDITASARRIPASVLSGSVLNATTISIPKHFQSLVRGNYLNLSPFTRYSLSVPGWGDIPVDTTKVYNADTLQFNITTDFISGTWILRITALNADGSAGGGILYNALPASIGVDIPLAQLTLDTLSAVQSGVDVIAGTVNLLASGAEYMGGARSGGALVRQIGNYLSTTTSSVISATEAQYPDVVTKSANGSISQFKQVLRLIGYFTAVAGEDNQNFGRPLCAVKVLKDIPGFQLVKNPEVVATHQAGIPSPTVAEIDQITTYLESGYYYE